MKLNRSYVISAIETQGRFGMGNGKEFVPSYQVEYSRNSGKSWHKWKDFRGSGVSSSESACSFCLSVAFSFALELRRLQTADLIYFARRLYYVNLRASPTRTREAKQTTSARPGAQTDSRLAGWPTNQRLLMER